MQIITSFCIQRTSVLFSLVRLPRGRVSQTQLNTGRDQNSSLATDHSERPLKNLCHTSYSHFHDFSGPRPISRTFQDLGPFPGLSRHGKCDFQITVLSSIRTNPVLLSASVQPTYFYSRFSRVPRWSVASIHCKVWGGSGLHTERTSIEA